MKEDRSGVKMAYSTLSHDFFRVLANLDMSNIKITRTLNVFSEYVQRACNCIQYTLD